MLKVMYDVVRCLGLVFVFMEKFDLSCLLTVFFIKYYPIKMNLSFMGVKQGYIAYYIVVTTTATR